MDYKQLKSLIPKNKYDFEPFPTLLIINEDEVKPILSDLLFWIADMNCPIALEMIKVLARFSDSVTPLIKKVLRPSETDEIWKYFIITDLIPELSIFSQKLLMVDIKRIIDEPTDGELREEVWNVAKDFFELHKEF